MAGFDASNDALRVDVGAQTAQPYGWHDYIMAPFNAIADGASAASQAARRKFDLVGQDFSNVAQYVFEHRSAAAAAGGCFAAGYYSAFTECPAGAELATAAMAQFDQLMGIKSGQELSLIVNGRVDLRDKDSVTDQVVPLLADMLKGAAVNSVDVRHTKLTNAGIDELSELLHTDHPGIVIMSDSGQK